MRCNCFVCATSVLLRCRGLRHTWLSNDTSGIIRNANNERIWFNIVNFSPNLDSELNN
jgi:hypothetical protein